MVQGEWRLEDGTWSFYEEIDTKNETKQERIRRQNRDRQTRYKARRTAEEKMKIRKLNSERAARKRAHNKTASSRMVNRHMVNAENNDESQLENVPRQLGQETFTENERLPSINTTLDAESDRHRITEGDRKSDCAGQNKQRINYIIKNQVHDVNISAGSDDIVVCKHGGVPELEFIDIKQEPNYEEDLLTNDSLAIKHEPEIAWITECSTVIKKEFDIDKCTEIKQETDLEYDSQVSIKDEIEINDYNSGCRKDASHKAQNEDSSHEHSDNDSRERIIDGKLAAESKKYFTHFKTQVKLNANLPDQDKKYSCDQCEKTYKHKACFRLHLKIHASGATLPKCENCDKEFTTGGNLRNHMLINTGNREHKCNICSKEFTSAGILKNQKVTHTGIKPHVCEICNKVFTQSAFLKVHMVTHTGIGEHKCAQCVRRFRSARYLKTHMLTHTGNKVYECKICNQVLSHLGNLRKHMYLHTGIKPFKCKICSKYYTQASSLKTHVMSAHSGIKPYNCAICSKGFSRPGILKDHLLTHVEPARDLQYNA